MIPRTMHVEAKTKKMSKKFEGKNLKANILF